MKNLFFVISVVCGLLLGVGCGNKSDGPRRPITTEQSAPTPAAAKPEPPKVDMVTLTSSTPFTVGDRYNVTVQHTADATKTRPRQDFDKVLYATILHPGERYQSAVKVVRILPSVFADPNVKSLNLDDPKLETLPAAGWRIGNRITVYIFKSEFGSTAGDRKVSIGGGEGEGKTLDELQRSPYFWRIVRSSAGTIYAEPDEHGMLTAFTPDGIAGYLARHREKESHKNYLDAIKEVPEEASYSIFYGILDDYKQYAELFDALPDAIKGPFIDNAVRVGKPYATERLGSEALTRVTRKYLLNITWHQVVAADPSKDPGCVWWPHTRMNVVVPHYGYDGNTCKEMSRVWLFWQRRGQFAFERAKAAVARELGSAPAATGTRRSR